MKTLSKKTHASILRATAKWFDEHPTQWIKNSLQVTLSGNKQGFCAMGAVAHVIGRFVDAENLLNVRAALYPDTYSGFSATLCEELVKANDGLCSSAKDISKVLRNTAYRLEHGHTYKAAVDFIRWQRSGK